MKRIVLIALFASLLLGLAGCAKKESPSDKLKKAIKELNEDVLDEVAEESDQDSDKDPDTSDQPSVFDSMFSSDKTDDTDVEEDDEEYTEEVQTEAPDIVGNDIILMDDAYQVFEMFAEFGYEYSTVNAAGEDPDIWSFEYKYLGNEIIDGVETKHYAISLLEQGETTVSEGWYDDTWSAVKYIDPSGEQTGVNAAFAGSNLTMMTQLYVNQALINSSFYTPGAALDELYYKLIGTRSETMDFGYGSTKVEIYDVESKFAKLILHSGYADFNDKKIIVILDQESEDGVFSGLKVTKAIPN